MKTKFKIFSSYNEQFLHKMLEEFSQQDFISIISIHYSTTSMSQIHYSVLIYYKTIK